MYILQYAGVNVPYPKDPEGWMSKIEGVEKSAVCNFTI